MNHVYCALVHHPVRDRFGETTTTAVTNLDVHDLARSARTYGLGGYFLVTPIAAQRALVKRILDHWQVGPGQNRVPERGEALRLCQPVDSIETACAKIAARHEGSAPTVVATAANPSVKRDVMAYATAKEQLQSTRKPWLVVFGTGHGLADSVLERAEHLLAPIEGRSNYRHLSVRAAAAIILDRLCARRDP